MDDKSKDWVVKGMVSVAQEKYMWIGLLWSNLSQWFLISER